ncbi:pseudouridine synthase [Aureococcus anophagefferens]|nr:pseudouridine synthase [Aureococcus anophagefferens]
MELRLARLLALSGVAAFSPPPATFARVAGSRPRASADDDVDAPESYEAVCAGPPARLDAFLAAQFPERTRREWAEAIGGGAVRVNGAVATRKSASVAAGDGVAAGAQFKARTVAKLYLAVLARPPPPPPDGADELVIDAPIGRHPARREKMAVVPGGRPAANARAAAAFAANRTLLHAWRLAFDHPDSAREVTAPPPPDLARATAVVAGRDG